MCLPIVRQGRILGVIYLENHLLPQVFTPARVTVLQLLASQAAISMENAQLYANVRKAEDKARQSEAQFKLAFDTIPTLAWSASPDGVVETLNRQWQNYTGRPPADDALNDWKAAHHPDDLARIVDDWNGIVRSGRAGEFKARMRVSTANTGTS